MITHKQASAELSELAGLPKDDSLKGQFLELISGKEKKWQEATELLVRAFLEENKIYTIADDVKTECWAYTDGVYLPQGKVALESFLRNTLDSWYSQYILNLVFAKVIADTRINHEEFFGKINHNEIPLLNGVLDIKSRQLRQYDKSKDIFFNKIPISYISTATCPNINNFFKDVLANEEDVKVMYELFGYSLDTTHFIEKAIMFVGDGRNGKGKSLELFKRFIGASNCASIPLVSMREDSFNLHQLHGKRVNLAGDLDNQSLKNTGLFKSITGRDTITAHRKFMTDLIFTSYAKNVFACNELPRVYDMSKGFWSRWVLFQFPYEFVKRDIYNSLPEEEKQFKKIIDTDIIEKISTLEEMSGLLNEALDGLDRLRENKDFSSSAGVDEIKEFWIRKASSFTAFCFDRIEENVDGFIEKSILRKEYSKYCKLHRLKGASDIEIKRTLEELFGATDSESYARMWRGICLK